MTYDVVALGELLIDFTGSGSSAQGNPLFEANPGGAPCNVLAMLSKLDKHTAFVGKVGDDLFGRLLKDTIAGAGIDPAGLVMDARANTTLAFVKNAPDGDREFSFFRNPGADTQLAPSELNEDILKNVRIFHFGSLSLTHQPARSATQKALELAKSDGASISFDPNLRPFLWDSPDEARAQILWGLAQCDIVKVAEEELGFIAGGTSIHERAQWLQQQFPQVKLLLVTKGKAGAEAFCNGLHASQPTFLQIKAIDTTGAGDSFCGCCLAYVLEHGVSGLSQPILEDMLTFANAAASLVSSKKGAIRSMPSMDDIQKLMLDSTVIT